MSVTAHSELSRTADRLEREADRLVDETAAKILAGARAGTRDITEILDESMRIETDGPFSKSVEVGHRRGHGFYAHIVEGGTSHSAPRPFLTPAAECERAPFERGLRDIFR